MQKGLQVDFSSWVNATSEPTELVLGEPGFTYPDLFDPHRLAELTERFFEFFQTNDSEGFARFSKYRGCQGEGMTAEEISEALLAGAPYLSRFVVRLFGVAREATALKEATEERSPLWSFKKDFAKKRLFKPMKSVKRCVMSYVPFF